MFRPLAATVGAAASAIAMLGLTVAPVAQAAPAPTNGGLFRPAPGSYRPGSAGSGPSETDYNWAGYAATGSKGAFSSSAASWTVPTVVSGHNGYSSTWVGIDGFSDQYLIQTGTEADMENGKASYYDWWEVITPKDEAPEVRYTNTVKPGDAMTASVTKGSGGDWTMAITDRTTGATETHTAKFSGPGKSAEWIQEDTDVDGTISPAPDWQEVSFTGVTDNGSAANLAKATKLDIVDTEGTQETQTSAPDGNAFQVKWLASGTGTPTG